MRIIITIRDTATLSSIEAFCTNLDTEITGFGDVVENIDKEW